MFGMGMPEIILILAIALIVLGPKKLPEIAKSLGRGIAEFKKATQDFKENIEVDNDFKEAKSTLQEIKGDLEQGVRQSVSGGPAGGGKSPEEEKDPMASASDDAPEEGTAPPLSTADKDRPASPPDPPSAEDPSTEGTAHEKGSVKDA